MRSLFGDKETIFKDNKWFPPKGFFPKPYLLVNLVSGGETGLLAREKIFTEFRKCIWYKLFLSESQVNWK